MQSQTQITEVYEDAIPFREKLVMVVFLITILVYRVSLNVVDLDLWHQMALIREAINSGFISKVDRYAYTPTVTPSFHHEWGAGVIAYLISIKLGAYGIIGIKYMVVSLISVCTIRCALKRKATFECVILLSLISILLIDHGFSPVRAQMYSFLFFSMLILAVETDREGSKKWILIFPFVFLLWINIHAGFVVGLGIMVLYWGEQLVKGYRHIHVLALIALIIMLVSITPYGISYYEFLTDSILMPRPRISEWHPLWKALDTHDAVYILSLLLLLYSVKKKGMGNCNGLVIVVSSAIGSLVHMRMLPFYAIAWMCYVPSYLYGTHLSAILGQFVAKRRKIVILILFFGATVCVIRTVESSLLSLTVPGEESSFSGTVVYPVGPVKYLKYVNFKGNIMVPFDSGSYVLWKLYPAVKVSLDSRYEAAYPPWLVEENYRFYMAEPGWLHALTSYPTDLILVMKKLPIARVLPGFDGWKKVYVDKQFELYARAGLKLPYIDWSMYRQEGEFP